MMQPMNGLLHYYNTYCYQSVLLPQKQLDRPITILLVASKYTLLVLYSKRNKIYNVDKKDWWTAFLIDIIENERDTVDLSNLSLEDVALIDWNMLAKCTSIINLSINAFPSTEKKYQSYSAYDEWFCKPPTYTLQEIESLFPSQIFELSQLKVLEIQEYPFSYLSPKISKLTELQELYIEDSPIICFPDTIGKLKKLNTLKFYCSRRMKYVPYELSYCTLLNQQK